MNQKELDTPAWTARIKEIDAIVEPLEKEREGLERKIIEYKSQFKIGDMIEWEGNRRGRVTSVLEWMHGEPMWRVIRILKDGTEGKKCSVYPWNNPVKYAQ